MDYFLAKATSTVSLYKPVLECLETLSENQRKFSLQDDVQLVNVILSPHRNVISLYSSSGNQRSANEMGKKLPRNGSLWEIQTASFTMLGELYSRTGSSFPLDIWQSTIQFLREGATEVATKSWKEQAGNTVVFAGGKIVRAAIKVLDECLRAISGFRGTEDFFGFPIYF